MRVYVVACYGGLSTSWTVTCMCACSECVHARVRVCLQQRSLLLSYQQLEVLLKATTPPK